MRPGVPELFASLGGHDVRYVVVGGLATLLHGVPRATLDVDLLIEPTRDNVQRLLGALRDIGLGTAFLVEADDVLANTITLFEDLLRVDVFLEIPGVDFATAWANHVEKNAGEASAHVISLDDLITSKRAKGRAKDLEVVAELESVRSRSDA